MGPKSLLVLALVSLAIVAGPNIRTCYGDCTSSGQLQGKSCTCNTENNSECCVDGQMYTQYDCSPPVTGDTGATMTINSFAEGGDGGDGSKCDGNFHNDSELVVALSTGWYDGGSRCKKNININANGRSVQAMVVDECDSMNGCDSQHACQPPCSNNIVDASRAVWDALAIPEEQIGKYDITWSDV